MHGRGVVPDLLARRQVRDGTVEAQPSTVLNRVHQSLQLLGKLLQLGLARVRRQLGRLAKLDLQLARLHSQLHLSPLGNMAWHCWIVNCCSRSSGTVSLTQETTQPALGSSQRA